MASLFTKRLTRLNKISVFFSLIFQKITYFELMTVKHTFLHIPAILAGKSDNNTHGTEHGVVTEERVKAKKPSQYRVLLLNDDFTPMDFVISILMQIFKKTQEEATRIMLNVHETGIGIAGVYTFEVAETKVAQVLDSAKRAGHPLKCTLEKA